MLLIVVLCRKYAKQILSVGDSEPYSMEKKTSVTAMWRPYHLKNNSYPNTITFCRKTAPRLSNEARIVRGLERKQGFADWFGYVF